MSQKNITAYHQELFNQFGYNFGFVADLLEKYLDNPDSVSSEWHGYFDLITGNKNGSEKRSTEMNVISPQENVRNSFKSAHSFEISDEGRTNVITGVGAKIIENMDASLNIPTATSLRTISVKLLEENRRIINTHLQRMNKGRMSFTHIVAYAVVLALKKYPGINNSFAIVEGKPNIVDKPYVNLGIAVDTERKDGTRSLIVPNIKKAGKMNFHEFYEAYNNIISKVKNGNIEPADFQRTTVTLTNPGGIGTVSSTPRLMLGQGCIIAIGAIDYPAEFKAMNPSALASLGIGKVMNITSTYDHRIIQGAESGEFLKYIDSLLRGEEVFYETIFHDLDIPQNPVSWGIDTTTKEAAPGENQSEIEKQAQILALINMYRVRGHLIANTNPLSSKIGFHKELDPSFYGFTIWDYDRNFVTANLKGLEAGTLRQILEVLHATYCEKIGAEYMHIQNPEEKAWLQSKMETIKNKPGFSNEAKTRIIEKLIVAESFEHFLHTKFIGHKRFSLEGNEAVIIVLDELLNTSASNGVKEVILGMAHRGRLNVLSNIIGKSYDKIFSEFEDNIDPDSSQGTGDVKYHLGATGQYETEDGKKIKISVSSNPSHLEWVNPVVEGIVRAKQTRIHDRERKLIIPLLIHGDAAFAGQGIVAETLNLSQLKGYRTGGTIHIIINNQIGFTTAPEDARSSPYATDVAKMVQSPIFHVNGDDPEACLWVTKLAFEYRQEFNKDVVIDVVGYRRHGHNEGDDPVYTQPLMYKKIKEHPSVKQIYAEKLIKENIITEKEIKKLEDELYGRLDKALKDSKKKKNDFIPDRTLAVSEDEYKSKKILSDTSVSFEKLSKVVKAITTFPPDFTPNPKLKKHIAKRKEFLTGRTDIDWAFGEALAFGSLLLEGVPVRLSGQDSARGTFSQRHLILTDINNEKEIIPHNNIIENQATLEPLDSLLSEAAVLGFEYGYSVADPLALVIWEAQFGDFANSAQVIIDNFISCSEKKWKLPNKVVMLLPHGQEGQGPEHSSARLERFLILCAEDNMYVTYPSTPAQYFHLLRRHVHSGLEKPLVIMSPKSILRLPAARSGIAEFTEGRFEEVIDNVLTDSDTGIKKIILTSGKVYYDLIKFKSLNSITDTAIIRIEQLYPFPGMAIENLLSRYPTVKDIRWVQEEPKNMGAWYFIFPRLIELIKPKQKLLYVGRPESPSPASGSAKISTKQQEDLIKGAFK
ncbi:MAG: multifunctional oxoglutarate decarboxylase/oxoglutarate dehydrogenase thiamine pyrophosphate-binding subunit/dihydrolipoyllysine-residue succinyltransferase subunit [Melioribacteraceae bacterium]|nr:multifunctional oxoglutarate decarboxylase/oxoglutarate dehydrogenase thiamine pyrophosphate-binding subunit/dihydrolipoyllysine-residue succinyltransferase subunit [Melioribacteraceae bacterium]